MKKLGFHLKRLASSVILLSACISPNTVQADAPNFRWAQQAGGVSREFGTGMAVDAAGNCYVIGKFSSSNAVFGSFTLTNGGLFIAKYDANGIALWARQVGPSSLAGSALTTLWIPRIAADGSGNGYLAGAFNGRIDFGGTILTNGNPNGGPNQTDFFLAKYDTGGNLVWARQGGGNGVTNNVHATALATDEAGNCHLAGDYFGTAWFGATNLAASKGLQGNFTAKFDTLGNLTWVRGTLALSPPAFTAFPSAIALGAAGDYYLCGQFNSAILTLGNVTLTNAGSWDLFIVRYDSGGKVVWAKRGGGNGQDLPMGLAVDASGACYIAGAGTAADGSGSNTSVSFDECALTNVIYFLVKYDQNGNVLWCKKSADFSAPLSSQGVLRSAADTAGNTYLLGQFFGTATFDSITLTNRGGNLSDPNHYPSYFVSKVDTEGRTLWAKQSGGADGEANYEEKGGIAVDAAGNWSVTGFIKVTNAVFDTVTLSTIGNEDIFVARTDADPPRLNIFLVGNEVVLSWPTNQPAFQLESTAILPPATNWSAVTNLIGIVGTQYFVTNEVAADARFFRLWR